ncbi:MAG TPA: TRL domain-containing protein [Syntrophales bacterium]|nr:TRL domain-containing protein [Syntrophales bacterium]
MTKLAMCIFCFIVLTGCALGRIASEAPSYSAPYGKLYTDITVPYTKVFNETPAGTKQLILNDHQIKDPVTGLNLNAEWTMDLIKSEANKAGIKEIYYIDQRTFSILFGIYRHKTLIVYGD